MKTYLLVLTLFIEAFTKGTMVYADTFYITPQGSDSDERDGRSLQSSWRSLAYACARVPAGPHLIQLEAGTYLAEQTAKPKSGVTIAGRGCSGEKATCIVAAKSWQLTAKFDEKSRPDEYIIALLKVENIVIRDLVLASLPEYRINGAIYALRSAKIEVKDLHVHDFRWAGLHFEFVNQLDVHHCLIENASTDKGRYWGGNISTQWIKDSQIHHNRIISKVGKGYGYRGRGHVGVRIHHNYFECSGEFALECAHENEFGVEIDHNFFNRCLSIPKPGQSADPNQRGFGYTFWIHDNVLTDSYTVEGPRNHARISHNYIRIEKTNGRVYTHHGGLNKGPVWIHHNVVENLDRALVWKNKGVAENVFVYNNTVLCADIGLRAGALISSPSAEGIENWVVKNNIFIAPKEQPRKLFSEKGGASEKITATHNLLIHVTGAPKDNYVDYNPVLKFTGEKPWPYFLPASDKSFVVQRGIDVGLPFRNKAPTLGAFEPGEERRLVQIPIPGKDLSKSLP